MKLKIKKTFRRKHTNPKSRKSYKKQRGGNNLIVEYDGIRVAGQEFSKAATFSKPSVQFKTNPNRFYTLIMWDPDVPSQAQPGFVHWLVTNLQSQNDINENQLLDYKGPSPPSGKHRYFFGLFEQTGHISPQQPERPNFNINEFVSKNNLKEIVKVYMTVSYA
jgi:phosphatidylethanolamine-binding protein (PEBP) family uncharacterized protein